MAANFLNYRSVHAFRPDAVEISYLGLLVGKSISLDNIRFVRSGEVALKEQN